jgi:hypothetical protein
MSDQYRDRFGFEPICRVLQVPTGTYTPTSTTSLGTRPARRATQGRDPARMEGELQVYGTHKVWRQL